MALSFNGTNQYLKTTITLPTVGFSMSAWFYSGGTGDHTCMGVSDGGGSGSNFASLGIRTGTGGKLGASTNIAGTATALSTVAVTANTWQHGLGVWASSSSRTVYLNGGNKGTDTTTKGAWGANNLTIGAVGRSTPIWYMSGWVGECAYWSTALPDDAAEWLAAGFSPLSPQLSMYLPYLLWYLPLYGKSGNAPNLAWGNQYPMTLFNAPTVVQHPPMLPLMAEQSAIWSAAVAGTPPTAPSALTATTASSSQIDCAWTDNSADEDNFELDYDTDSGFGSATTVTPAANATSYNVTGLSPSTLYYFRIRAVNGAGNSAYTATASDTTDAAGVSTLLSLFGPGMTGGLQTMDGGLG